MNIRKTYPQDITRIVPIEGGMAAQAGVQKVYAQKDAMHYTVLDESDHPLAIVGAHVINPKNYEVWVYADIRAKEKPIMFCKAMRVFRNSLVKQENPHRLQALINARYPWADTWAKFMGFEKEAELKKYGQDGSTFNLYSCVRNDG